MEGSFNNRNIKPTLSTPTTQGKQLDTFFKKQVNKTGMKIKEATVLHEKEESLKKKIFKLDKMETLVHTDEYLSKIFNDMSQNAAEQYGYHWNETILNMIFNDYVLNSPKYLQKYKDTRAKVKKRRGEEGIKELQNDIEKDSDASASAEARKNSLMKGTEQPKEEKDDVNELFGFGNATTSLPMNKRSKNDTYFVDVKRNKLIAPLPYNSTPDEKQAIISKYVGNPDIKQLSWYDAVKKGIKGVPTEVPDGSIQALDQEFAQKYPQQQNMVSLAEKGSETYGSRPASPRSVIIGSAWNVANKIESILPDNYSTNDVERAVEKYWIEHDLDFDRFQNDNEFWDDLYHFLQDIKPSSNLGETTGAAGAGAFAPALDNDKSQVTETTTSASSGQYSGTAIWAKSPKSARLANKPAWHGGKIVSESVIEGDKNYLTDPTAFKKYIAKNELIEMINESFEMGEAESFQQHSEKMLAKLQQYATENPDLSNDPDFKELMQITAQRAGKNSAQKPQQSTGTQPIQTNVSEHHLHSKQEKIDFILNNSQIHDADTLNSMEDSVIDSIYHGIEKEMGIDENDFKQAMYKDLKYTGNKVRDNESENELESQDGLFKGKWNTNETAVEEGIFGNSNQELNIDQIATMIDNFKQSPESSQLRNQFVTAKDYIKTKVGNVAKMPQLKMWLDQNMPQLSNNVGILWGNWDLMPTNKINENKKSMNIDKDQYATFLKKKLQENVKKFKSLNENEKKNMLQNFHTEFKKLNESSMLDDQPNSMINNQDDSMASSMNSDELNTDGQPIPNAVSGVSPVAEGSYDNDDMKAKSSLADKYADYSDEEPAAEDDATSDEPEVKSPEKTQPSYHHSGSEDTQTIQDAEKFRNMLKTKYGVDSVSDLSPMQRQEVLRAMQFDSGASKEKGGMDFTQFNTSDADKAAYHERDNQKLNFLAQNANRINSIGDYSAIASEFKNSTGENMFHPMAILASIERMPPNSPMRDRLKNVENVLKSQMVKRMEESDKKQMNEDRKVSAILNVEKLGAENARNFKADSAKEDGLEQDKTYPKDDGLHKAPVWPDPKDFYIEQDLDKVQREAKTSADIEKEVLAKTKGSLENIGNATADGKHIPKRNLTKEEAYELAMNRGRGMQDIVYDNKPSEKFEERMKTDMGDNVYKSRQDKMKYTADAPMYNKDTQPTQNGDKKEQDNKFAKGYNNESVMSKYVNEFGKVNIFEFELHNVTEIKKENGEYLNGLFENAFKLSVSGLGNKYTSIRTDKSYNKTINENKDVNTLINKYDFYLHENKVVALEKSAIVETKIEVKKSVNESFDKMKHLMNYKPHTYVDTKKSVKF